MKKENFLATISSSGLTDKQLVLEGQLTIRNAASIKKALLEIPGDAQNIQVKLKNVIKIDLAVLQLLVAFKKNGGGANKTISLNEDELTGNVKSAIHNSGLQKILTGEI